MSSKKKLQLEDSKPPAKKFKQVTINYFSQPVSIAQPVSSAAASELTASSIDFVSSETAINFQEDGAMSSSASNIPSSLLLADTTETIVR